MGEISGASVKRATFTTADPIPPGAWVQLDGEHLLRVVACTDRGPLTVAACRVTRWCRALAWVQAHARRPRVWWLNTRCLPDDGWCWRRATAVCLCDRHWLEIVGKGEL